MDSSIDLRMSCVYETFGQAKRWTEWFLYTCTVQKLCLQGYTSN